jgi:hypothetical protein
VSLSWRTTVELVVAGAFLALLGWAYVRNEFLHSGAGEEERLDLWMLPVGTVILLLSAYPTIRKRGWARAGGRRCDSRARAPLPRLRDGDAVVAPTP